MRVDPAGRRETLCLGIEGTAHTLGMGVVSSAGKILADVRDSYVPAVGRGIHPREASQHHGEVVGKVLAEALQQARIGPEQIGLVAFSQGPGLGPCLRTTATTARALSTFLNVPLVGVNHIVAHIEVAKLMTGAVDPLVLILSGGTTQIVALEDRRYRVFGETLDITVANCLDVFAREVGLTDPGKPWLGPKFDETASKGNRYIPLPYTVKGMDLQFSGLLSAALRKHKEADCSLEDLCFSLQETALSMVAEVAERALAHTRKPSLVLTGGFARNRRLQSMLASMVKEHDATLHVAPHEYAADNGAMIAWTGILAYNAGQVTPVERSHVRPRWRVDSVPIPW
ncbi:MAG: KEOPS complex N(6)-L-threonylcarbamoyladenine synthase Kae1 [Candidatus Bathyarchaeia archaeon]